MTLQSSSDGWYYDELASSIAWTYGKEIWCNLEGRYMYIIADLSHLVGSYTMSLCSLGIMGTEYVHSKPPPTDITITKGSTTTIDVPHITSALTIGNTLQMNMRQRTGT